MGWWERRIRSSQAYAPYVEAGMDYWMVALPGWPALDMLDLFIEEVIPRIHAAYGDIEVTSPLATQP